VKNIYVGRKFRVVGTKQDVVVYDKFTRGRIGTESCIYWALKKGARMVVVLTVQHPMYEREIRDQGSMTVKISRDLKEFLKACIDAESFESNGILQDYMTPEVVAEIEQLLEQIQSKRLRRASLST